MKKRKLLCVILAAGKGTRMKSSQPKVLHKVAGLPMLTHVIRAAETLSPDQIVAVVGPNMESVSAAAAPHDTVIQTEQLGTGHAARVALAGRDLAETDVLILYGDVPLTPPQALQDLIETHRAQNAAVTILAMCPENPTGYGRLVTNAQGHVMSIVEEVEATESERAIRLCNSGMMALRGEGLMEILANLKNNNAKGEYYLTDVLALSRATGGVCTFVEGHADDLNGVNDRVQLAAAELRLQQKLREAHMRAGVTMIDPLTVYFSVDTVLGQDVVIEPNVFFGPGVQVMNDVKILANCHLEQVIIGQGAHVGPFARIREQTVLGSHVHIGNFVEVKKSNVGTGTAASHLTYLCDLDIGEKVNIGAGAIFSNYDGVSKHRTKIEDRAFIGANATLVSPVTVGADAYIAAGSVITDDVPADKLAFGRARQTVRDHTQKTSGYSNKKKGK